MVEPDAFTVGEDLAVTPGAVVLRTAVFELIQYRPTTETVRAGPAADRPADDQQVLRADLAPGRSMVELPGRAGPAGLHDVLAQPGRPARQVGPRHLRAGHPRRDGRRRADHRRRDRRSPWASAPAASSPRWLLAHLAAHRPQDRVAALTLAGHRARPGAGRARPARSWTRHRPRPATAASRRRGYLDGAQLAEVFAWLRPNDLIWNYWVNNYLQGKPPPAFDILFWNADTTRMTRRAAPRLHRHRAAQRADRARRGRPCSARRSTCPRSPSTPTSSPASPTTSARGRPATAAPSCSAGYEPASCCPPAGTSPSLVNPPGNPKSTLPGRGADDTAGRPRSGWSRRTTVPGLVVAGLQRPGSASAPARRSRRRPTSAAAHDVLEAAPGTYVFDK